MVRKIEYELDDVGRVSPSIEQQAGVQGDHKATTLEFKIPNALIENIYPEDGEELKYRFDVYTGAGTHKNYAEIEPLETENYLYAYLPLEEAVTRYGGKITVVLLIVGIRNDSTEHIVQSFPVKLKLAQKPNEGGVEGDSREELETLVVQAERARDKSRGFSEEAEGYAENAKDSADRAKEIKEEIESQKYVKKVNGKLPNDEGQVVVDADDIYFDGSYSVDYELRRLESKKQDKLTAGKNVTINGNVISAEGGGAVESVNGKQGDVVLTSSDIHLTEDNRSPSVASQIAEALNSASQAIGAASGANITANQAKSTADSAFSMAGGATLGVAELRESKQDKLTAGNNITIEGNVISASGGGGSFGYPKKIFDTTVTADNQSTTILAEIDANGTNNYTELFVRCRIYSVDGAVAFNVSGKNITFQVNESDSSAATKFGTVAILTTTWNTAHSRCLYGHIRVLENSIVCETNTPANSTNLDGELYSLTTERTGCPLIYNNFTKVKRFRVAMTQSGAPVFPVGTRLEIWGR